ncbi:MAG: hypothetical protein IKM28_07290 [Lachnospiraceae bacterium]|nr:hypothetical protein [Lachnospiraceae bacterium]
MDKEQMESDRMGFVIEFFMELLLEGSVVVVKEKKVPIGIRILAGIVLLVFCLLFLGGVVSLCLNLSDEGNTVAFCLVLVVGLLIGSSFVYAIGKKCQEYKNKK